MTIYLRSLATISSSTPATFCSLEPDRPYLLTMKKSGYETRTTRFIWTSDRQLKFMSRRPRHLLYSLLMPGWGQAAEGEHIRSLETFAGFGTAAVLWHRAYRDYEDEKDSYNYLGRMVENSITESRRNKYADLQRLSARLVNAQRKFSLEVAVLGGWLYLGNLAETMGLSAPPKVVSVRGTDVGLEVPARSRTRAVFRSFFFPGLGQKYLGKSFKGFVYYSSFIAGAYLTLNARRDYEIAAVGYETAVTRLSEARTLSDVRRARSEIDLTYENLRDTEKTRNAFYVVLGSLWALNILDAAVSADASVPDNRVGFETSYHGSEFRMGLRFGI